MLPAANQPIDPIYALAALIEKQKRGMPMNQQFSTPGLGARTPIDPVDQLKVPGQFNPGFPDAPSPSSPPAGPQPGLSAPPTPSLQRAPRPQGMMPPMPGPQAGLSSAAMPGSMPATTGALPQGPTPPALPMAPADEPGPLGRMMSPGLRNGLVDALAALGGLDSRSSPLQALGQTFSAGQDSKRAREDRKASLASSQYEREHTAYREQVGDTRAAAADTRDEKRLSIEERKAAVEERRGALRDIQTAAGIEHTQAETAKIEREYAKGGLTTDQMLKVENQVTDYGKTLVPSGSYSAIDPTSEQGKNIKKAMDDYRTQLIQSLTSGADAGAAPSGPTGAAPMNSPPAGQGTWDAPMTFPGNSLTREAIEKLPKGTIFIGPDGQKMERQ